MDEHDRGLELEPPLPEDARRKGLTPVVAPGLQFASSLRADKFSHRVIACGTLGLIAAFVLICAGTVLSG
ncbi:MAG TPA: hypothetical protein VG502_19050 [Flexivirga sp.]|uniref:hypothetical protein n=1 Tax=Flexivirga sp. TaxID=1962927 RepID=UPI002B7ABA6D|nr:hypothetical protein [Flexivirga sp.]HWC24399.1 hypothetical protein [Flexivirga sp.]